MVKRRGPQDVVGDDGHVRVLSHRCRTCIFHQGARAGLTQARFEEVVRGNVEANALLTCHATLPGNPWGFDPAVCAGFWARHGMRTVAGRLARFALGVTRMRPPGET